MNLSLFLKNNLISGYQNGSFSEQQVNIYAMNYLMNGRLEQGHFEEIQAVLYPLEVEEV